MEKPATVKELFAPLGERLLEFESRSISLQRFISCIMILRPGRKKKVTIAKAI
jgi:hypothetical protein